MNCQDKVLKEKENFQKNFQKRDSKRNNEANMNQMRTGVVKFNDKIYLSYSFIQRTYIYIYIFERDIYEKGYSIPEKIQ